MHPVKDLCELEQGSEHVRVEQLGQVYFGVSRWQSAQRGMWFEDRSPGVGRGRDGFCGRDGWSGLVVVIIVQRLRNEKRSSSRVDAITDTFFYTTVGSQIVW